MMTDTSRALLEPGALVSVTFWTAHVISDGLPQGRFENILLPMGTLLMYMGSILRPFGRGWTSYFLWHGCLVHRHHHSESPIYDGWAAVRQDVSSFPGVGDTLR